MTTVDAIGFHHLHDGNGHLTAELRLAARMLPTLSAPQRERLRGEMLRLLEDVEPHATVADDLHPCLAYDHLAIRDWIHQIESCNVNDAAYLQELLYGLDALIRVHVWREQELFIGA